MAPPPDDRSTPTPTPPAPRPPQSLSTGLSASDDPLNQESTHLTPEEETEAMTEFALLQLAEREGHQAMPEDLIFERTDPFAAETARDRALTRFFDQQALTRRGAHRAEQNQSTGNRQQAQRASAQVKWTVGARPKAVPAVEDEPPARRARAPRTTTPKARQGQERLPKASSKATPTKATPTKATPTTKRATKTSSSKAASNTKRTTKGTNPPSAIPGEIPAARPARRRKPNIEEKP